MTRNLAVEKALKEEIFQRKEFAIRNLSVLAYAQGFTFWHYKTNEIHMSDKNGFFDDASDMLAIGDVLLVSGPLGAKQLCVIDNAKPVKTQVML